MNIGKIFENRNLLITIVIVLAVTLALLVTMAVLLNKDNNDQPTGTDGTTQITEPSGTENTGPDPTDPQVKNYTVTFKDHDGKVLKTETVEEGKAATAPADPTREGYTFEGWDKAFDKVTANMEVTATYKAVEAQPTNPKPTDPQTKTYTVTFKDYDGTVLKTQKVESGKAATAPADPTRTGYTFTGWDKSFNKITADLVVTATYKAEETKPTDPVVTTYTVTFKDWDGTVLKTEKVEKDKAATAPADPTRTHYTFAGWDKAFNKITADLVVTATYKINEYTVTFKDYDGTVLKTQKVESGKAATAPADPTRENYKFAGWDKAFNNVTSDLVVTATYSTTKLIISAESVTVNKGTNEVTMKIRVTNNPGIMGAVLKVSVNDDVFAFARASKTGYPGLTLTAPGSATTSSPYTFMLDSMDLSADDKKDGTLFTITFKIKDTSATGNYEVKLSCNKGGIFDENYNDLDVTFVNGTITIQ